MARPQTCLVQVLKFTRYAPAVIAVVTLAVVLPVAAWGGDPAAIDLDHALQPPSWREPFGTDHLGRSLAARLDDGLWRTLTMLGIVMFTGVPVGIGLGLVAAIGPAPAARLALVLVRAGAAFPAFVVALASTAVFGLSPVTAGVAIGVSSAAQYGLVVAELARWTMGERFVLAAGALGVSRSGIAWRHLLPAVAPVLSRHLSTDLARAVLAYAGLAFIGLGADTGRPDWGALAWEYRHWASQAPWLLAAPVAAIAILAAGLSFSLDRGWSRDAT